MTRSGRTIRAADPMPEPPAPQPPAPVTTPSGSPKRGPGRPSKLEERAYQAYLTVARPGMSPPMLRNMARASWEVAEVFEETVRTRRNEKGRE